MTHIVRVTFLDRRLLRARTERFRFLAGTACSVASPQPIQRVKSNDGSLETLVQCEPRAKGLRFRCHVRTLPGRPDIVFPRERVSVFVDGDFWHGWRLHAWEDKLSEFWRIKLHANSARDQRNFRRLRALGWRVIRLWQHEVLRDLAGCGRRVADSLREPKPVFPRPCRGAWLVARGSGGGRSLGSLDPRLMSGTPPARSCGFEATRDDIGRFDGPADLSTNPRHLEDFGR